MNSKVREIVRRFNEMNTRYNTNKEAGITDLNKVIFYLGEKRGNKSGNIYGKEFVAVINKLINTDLSMAKVGEEVSKETGKNITVFRVQDIVNKCVRLIYNQNLYNGKINLNDVSHEEILDNEKIKNIESFNNEMRKFIDRYGIGEVQKILEKYTA